MIISFTKKHYDRQEAILLNLLIYGQLLCCLAQRGTNFACAESHNASLWFGLDNMDVSDSIETGDSYFIAESRTIKRMLESLEQRDPYFFIDRHQGDPTLLSGLDGLRYYKWLAKRRFHLYILNFSHDVSWWLLLEI